MQLLTRETHSIEPAAVSVAICATILEFPPTGPTTNDVDFYQNLLRKRNFLSFTCGACVCVWHNL